MVQVSFLFMVLVSSTCRLSFHEVRTHLVYRPLQLRNWYANCEGVSSSSTGTILDIVSSAFVSDKTI